VELDASYKNATKDPTSAQTQQYYEAVAYALHVAAISSPKGMLVFFKSYKLLELMLARWKQTNWWVMKREH
jgi:Rad3-related DNA helicase